MRAKTCSADPCRCFSPPSSPARGSAECSSPAPQAAGSCGSQAAGTRALRRLSAAAPGRAAMGRECKAKGILEKRQDGRARQARSGVGYSTRGDVPALRKPLAAVPFCPTCIMRLNRTCSSAEYLEGRAGGSVMASTCRGKDHHQPGWHCAAASTGHQAGAGAGRVDTAAAGNHISRLLALRSR